MEAEERDKMLVDKTVKSEYQIIPSSNSFIYTGTGIDKFNMDCTEDYKILSPVEVKIELDESGRSIPFCFSTWGQTSDNQCPNPNRNVQVLTDNLVKNELCSEMEIKQEPVEQSLDILMCKSEADIDHVNIENRTLRHLLCQPISVKGISYNDSLTCSKPLLNTSHDTVSSGDNSSFCPYCPEMKFVSDIHLLAHNMDKHGFKVPGDLVNTVESQSTPIGLSEFGPTKESTTSDTNCKFKSNKAITPGTDGNKHFEYTVCDLEGHRKNNVTGHIKTCDFNCTHKCSLERHKKIHTDKSPFQCTICGFKCFRKILLTIHIKTHFDEKPFQCAMCSYRCHLINNLTSHIKTHSYEKPFQCTICDYRCQRKDSLASHIKTHSDEKPFQCTMCDYKSRVKRSLSIHIKTHSDEKAFQCTVCNYKTHVKGSLKTHIKIHTDEKPFQCTMCDFKSRYKANLKKHIKTHTDEKPFQCTVCDYKGLHKSSLKEHVKIHTAEKPFQCTICDFKCRRKVDLRNHILTHTGEKRFQCTLCDYRCSSKTSLVNHVQSHTG